VRDPKGFRQSGSEHILFQDWRLVAEVMVSRISWCFSKAAAPETLPASGPVRADRIYLPLLSRFPIVQDSSTVYVVAHPRLCTSCSFCLVQVQAFSNASFVGVCLTVWRFLCGPAHHDSWSSLLWQILNLISGTVALSLSPCDADRTLGPTYCPALLSMLDPTLRCLHSSKCS